MRIVRQLGYNLRYEPLVVVPYERAQVLLNVDSARVAYLESLDAHLGHGERQDLDLLEAAVDDDTGLEASGVKGQRIRHECEDALDLESFEEHGADDLGEGTNTAKPFAQHYLYVLRADFERVIEHYSEELLDLVLKPILLVTEGFWERVALQLTQIFANALAVLLLSLVRVNISLMRVVQSLYHGQGRLNDVQRQ